MKPRLLATFILLTVMPLAVLAWLGARVVAVQRETVERRFHQVLEERLRDVADDIAGLLDERKRELLGLGGLASAEPDSLREYTRQSPVFRQFFVLDEDARLLYPSDAGPLSKAEEAFLDRTHDVWLDQELLFAQPQEQAAAVSQSAHMLKQAPPSKQRDSSVAGSSGWYTWYWGSGLDLLFWWRDGGAEVVGAELDTTRLIADIVGILPDTGEGQAGQWEGRAALVGARDEVLYQWGAFEPSAEAEPVVSLVLDYPLNAWRLEYFLPDDALASRVGAGALMGMLAGLAGFGIALVLLAVYFYRESSRDLREAAHRVTFVNQVSHELKTPLTNIRMYAEMLGDSLDGAFAEGDEKPRRYLDVIVDESRRLSRLIGNILTFSRNQRRVLSLHKTRGVVDEAIEEVLEHFGPAFGAKGIKVVFSGQVRDEAEFDRDAVGQILGNLLNNVEKYAALGKRVDIASQQEGDVVTITVQDYGPGIRGRDGERVFRPFFRVSDRLTDGVAGTGIGLAIARDLARLHGGDLTLEACELGACFVVRLKAEAVGEGR